ncbi:MAG: condensation domain-containing protein [Planctomycetota bacterium]
MVERSGDDVNTTTTDRLDGIVDIYPLTPAQRGMLFHTLVDRSSGAYVIQVTFELTGTLDTAAF